MKLNEQLKSYFTKCGHINASFYEGKACINVSLRSRTFYLSLDIDFFLFRLFLTIVTINRNDFAIRLVLVIFAIKKRNRIMTVVIILSLFSRLFSSRSEHNVFCRTLFLGFKRLLFRLLQSLRSIEKTNCS